MALLSFHGGARGVLGLLWKTTQGSMSPEFNTRECPAQASSQWYSPVFPCPFKPVCSVLGQGTLGGGYPWVSFALESGTPCGDHPLGSCFHGLLPPSRGNIH